MANRVGGEKAREKAKANRVEWSGEERDREEMD